MKMKLKTKDIIKKVALALAGVAAITAVGFGVKAIVDYTKDDLKKITLSYDVGNLGTDGKYVNDESTLYTKEAFGCYGLQVKPDFDSTVNYQIFYYDILDNYISSTEFMSDGYSGEAPVNGAYARIVIEPRNDEDGKISFTEKLKYPSQLTVKVKKNQDINKRFVNFAGKVMDVVSDNRKLIFVNGLSLSTDPFVWTESTNRCVTSSTVLKVAGGSTVKFNVSKLNEEYSSSYYSIYQFKGLPLEDNFIGYEFSSDDKTCVLDKNTEYIIICVDTDEGEVLWNDVSLSLLPECFTVTKTK